MLFLAARSLVRQSYWEILNSGSGLERIKGSNFGERGNKFKKYHRINIRRVTLFPM